MKGIYTRGREGERMRVSVGKRPLGRPRRKWDRNIEIDFRVMGWIHLAQDRDQRRTFVNTKN